MMNVRVVYAALMLLITATACREDSLDLNYRFEAGAELRYVMTATANAEWDIGGPGEGSYRVTFEVLERVRSVTEDGAVVSVVMTPSEVEQEGLPSPGARERTFALRLGTDGEVVEVLEIDGVPATDLGAEERAFIGTYRPPLPPDAVSLGDEWQAEQQLQLPSVFQQINTNGEVDHLRRDEDAKIAELAYEGAGPLVWTTVLPQGAAELTGSTSIDAHAVLDVDGGFLREASSTTSGSFEVRVVRAGEEQVPLSGRLQLDLDVELEKVD